MMDFLALYQYEIIGIIFMLVLGPAVGNYACSVVYRLPRGQTPFDRHPFCGHCGTDLKPVDLFPILSWLSTKGRCRYCQGPVPGIYTLIELACGVVFIGYFLQFSIGEHFLLSAAYAVFVIILAAIQWQQGWISSSIYGYAFFFIALMRTLREGTIYGWIESAFIMLALCIACQRFVCWYNRTPFKPFDTPWIWWLVLLAAFLPPAQWQVLGIAAIVLVLFRLGEPRLRQGALLPVTALALFMPIWIIYFG